MDTSRIIFIHGSESNGQTHKAQVLRSIYPGIITPDFSGSLAIRLSQLETIIQGTLGWTLIGSSLGGLIAAVYTLKHPNQICNLVLMAPALHLPEFSRLRLKPVKIPTLLIIGRKDDVIPCEVVHRVAKRFFPGLIFLSVDDDHRLHHTTECLDWNNRLF
jgi:pimeloyl-ACP methyl ester carboxylesterase